MKTKHFILSAFLLIFFEACQKNYPVYFVPDEVKQFGYFQKGSWWLYKDEISGKKDSAYVTSVDQRFEIQFLNNTILWKNEYFDIGIKHTLPISEHIFVRTDEVQVIFKNDTANREYFFTVLKFDPEPVDQAGLISFRLLSDTVINNKHFSNVYHVKRNDRKINNFWFVKNQWLIKRKIYLTENDSVNNYNIIDYHIIQ